MFDREPKNESHKDRKFSRRQFAGFVLSGIALASLTACGPSETKATESPAPTASAPVTTGTSETPRPSASETATGVNNEVLKQYLATVDKYPTADKAANALFAGPDMDVTPPVGVFNQVMGNAGHDQRDDESVSVPPEAIIALYGPEPEGGYPSSVQGAIEKWQKDYKQFQDLYIVTKSSDKPFQCYYQLEVTSSNDHGIRGKYTQACVEISVPGSRTEATDFQWSEWLNLTMAQRTDETTGQKVWYITEVRDGETIRP